MARFRSGRTDHAIAQRLREAREKAGLSREQVASQCQVSNETIANWESGRSDPRASQLKTLCALYRTTPNELVLGCA